MCEKSSSLKKTSMLDAIANQNVSFQLHFEKFFPRHSLWEHTSWGKNSLV